MDGLKAVRRSRPKVVLCLAGTLLVSTPLAAETWQRPGSAVAPAPAVEARVRLIVAGMTLEQKIGQMTQPDIRSVMPDDVRKYYIGSVLNGGGAWPGMNMHASVGDWLKLSDDFYRASMSTDMKVKVPTQSTVTTIFMARRSSRRILGSARRTIRH
jgi:beta-glucosidase